MKKKLISKYIISFCFILVMLYGRAQENNPDTTQQQNSEEIKTYPQRYGLRLGVDLFRITRSVYDKTYNGFEITGDYRFSKNLYFAAELGHDRINKNEDIYDFTTNGNYLKLGVDINLHQNWMDREDLIYVGFRYGFSSFSQNLNWYKPYTTDPYFETSKIYVDKKYNGLSAHWLEFVVGLKTRVFNNVFVGFSMRLNGLITQKQPDDFENLFIPGFNKKHSGNIGVGFNYSVSYLIPLYKSKKNQFIIPDTSAHKPNLEGNLSESEELKIINENKQSIEEQ
jgi:hypothetical protein